jgi:hypothetical protein
MAYSQAFIDEHRDFNVDHDWWDTTHDDFNQICEIMGIELGKNEPSFSGFWSQGDGASWTGRYRAQALSLNTRSGYTPTYDLAPAKIREYCGDEEIHRIADELCLLARIYGPVYAVVSRNSSRYSHSNTMQLGEWEYYDERDPDEVDGAIIDHIEQTLICLFTDLADWFYSSLEREHEYLTSDEAVIEALEANEIEEAQDEAA